MASETLGAVALLDPAIKLGRKVWKTYKLQASFGEDFKDYSNHFLSEGVMLDELLRTPIFLLNDHDTNVEFSTAIQEVGSSEDLRQLLHSRPDEFQKARTILSKLAKLSSLFEKCAELIERYLPQPDTPQGLSPEESRTSSLRTAQPQHNQGDVSLDPHSTAREPQTSNAPLGLAQQEPKSSKSVLHRMLHRRKDINTRIPKAAGKASVGPERLKSQDIQDQSALESLQSLDMQSSVGGGRRVRNWAWKDRELFKTLIREIQDLNVSLERLVVVTDIRQRTEPVEPSASIAHVPPANAAPYLAVLAKVLVEASVPAHYNFMLELKDDYKKYAEEARSSSAYLHLAPGAFMFPIMVIPSSSSDGDLQTPLSVSRSSEVLIEIKQGCAVGSTSQAEKQRWDFIRDLSDDLRAPAQYYQDQTLLCVDQHSIRIFQHYPASASIMTSIADMLHDIELRKDKELVGFRYHLAYNIAAFFSTGQPPISSRKLFFFFETQPSEMDAEERVKRLTAPYLNYEMHPDAMRSLHGPQHQLIPVRKLGILMHEIGSWIPIGPPMEMDKAIDTAKANAVKSRSALGLAYYNVVQECLNWPEHFRGNGFREKVLIPLLDLKSRYPLPTDEIY